MFLEKRNKPAQETGLRLDLELTSLSTITGKYFVRIIHRFFYIPLGYIPPFKLLFCMFRKLNRHIIILNQGVHSTNHYSGAKLKTNSFLVFYIHQEFFLPRGNNHENF